MILSVNGARSIIHMGKKIMQNARQDEAQAGIKIAGRNMLESRLQGEISITSDMQMKPPLWQKAKRN